MTYTKTSTSVKLASPSDLGSDAKEEIAKSLNALLADAFALYIKTKNFHWHVSGPHFRDYHLLLDDQAAAIFAIIDPIAERVRKLGNTTLRSVGQIAEQRRIEDNNADFVAPQNMLNELRKDNESLVRFLREVHKVCDTKEDVATASLIEDWIDQAEERIWFLLEAGRS
ncbi:DNA starvation/stationary phase protection protein [Paraburkholderia panacisoli]|jgi:starvation-inducible DNA-binding protein|uniref:DNA starvation/stationary phase protection protein n=1 Tax=Paraburkholderia panacisoli TaxID=2603818 RepID=A0A5B0HH66_9BURK|nr:DNA starvation/stationary phase protection protein [Paraburkholderia panacisoli]KAA1014410.1 DNA starvation/stationary phase protection protein [Paraburkholderia panacisoli]